MSIFKLFCSVMLLLLCSITALGSRPANGVTNFNATSPGQKAYGAAGAAGITASDIAGFSFKLSTAAAPADMVIEVWDGAVGTGLGVAFYEATSTINPRFTSIIMKSNDGALFDLNSIGLNMQSSGGGNANITITGLDGSGNPIAGAITSGTASVSALTVFNVSSNPAFRSVSAISITSTDLVYAFIDNISVANVGAVLPLTWLNFSAANTNLAVLLQWGTAAEHGTSHFAVEHSLDGRTWQNVGNVNAAGMSSVAKYYSFSHATPSIGSNYYRLALQEQAGHRLLSDVLYINTGKKNSTMQLYPTIVKHGSTANVSLSSRQTLQVYDAAGNLVLQKELPGGVNLLAVQHLPKGIYYVKAGETTSRLLIQ